MEDVFKFNFAGQAVFQGAGEDTEVARCRTGEGVEVVKLDLLVICLMANIEGTTGNGGRKKRDVIWLLIIYCVLCSQWKANES